MQEKGRFQGKVVLITGTGGAQGRVAAMLFAREGAIVVGCDVMTEQNKETARTVEEAGGKMTSIQPIDLSDLGQCRKVVEEVEKSHGRLDILYNNAGAAKFAPISEMSIEDWSFTIRNELDQVFSMTKSALPLMIKSGGGSIVNTSSIVAIQTDENGNIAHSATKGAIISLTRTLAVELAPFNIRVNAILPGPIDKGRPMPHLEKSKREWIENCPMHRIGRPEEPVKAAMFLASDDASFITGTALVVDGGYSAR